MDWMRSGVTSFVLCIFAHSLECAYAQQQIPPESKSEPQQNSSSKDSLTISVLKSENYTLDIRAAMYPFALKPSDSVSSAIRREVRQEFNLENLKDDEAFNRATAWAHGLWRHDPVHTVADRCGTLELLRRAHRGERFTCVEYAKVLSDLLVSYGYCARMVGLSRRNISNPQSGARHVGVECWSGTYNKWVFLDPQFAMRAMKDDSALTAYEMQQCVLNNDSNLRLVSVVPQLEKAAIEIDSERAQYRRFIAVHSAFTDIPYIIGSNVGLAMLVPKDRNEPMMFQGVPLSNIEFTKDPSLLYASLGTVEMDLDYNYKENTPTSPLRKPAYMVRCSTSYPWIRCFELKLDSGEWTKLPANTFQWTIHPGINELRTRAMCSSGSYTKEAFLKVYFGERSEARKLRHPERYNIPQHESGPIAIPRSSR